MKQVPLIGAMAPWFRGRLSAGSPSPAAAAGRSSAVATLAQDNLAFAGQLYRQLVQDSENTFFSPFSVSSALAMSYGGAREKTAREMAAALHFQLDQDRLHSAFRMLNSALVQGLDRSRQKLNIANALILTGGDVDPAYKQMLEKNYDAEIFATDLNAINGWVKQKTEAKIEKIFDQLNPNSVGVILNAIYFKGVWEYRFDPSRTREAPFKRPGADPVSVPLMQQKGDFKLLSQADFQAISLPYEGQALSMVVLLPMQVDGLGALEANATPERLAQWLGGLERRAPRPVLLCLPRFKLETGYDLVAPLKQMGIRDAFDMDRADFSGMGWPKGKLFISQVEHRALVEVSEEGTEAAASTGVEMATRSMSPSPEVFKADHPFLFLIRHNPTGTLLFMGRVTDPGLK
jgi:serpin B